MKNGLSMQQALDNFAANAKLAGTSANELIERWRRIFATMPTIKR